MPSQLGLSAVGSCLQLKAAPASGCGNASPALPHAGADVGDFFRAQAAHAAHSHWQIVQLAPTPTPGESHVSGLPPACTTRNQFLSPMLDMKPRIALSNGLGDASHAVREYFKVCLLTQNPKPVSRSRPGPEAMPPSWSLTGRMSARQACSARGCWPARPCTRCCCACRACSMSTRCCRRRRPSRPRARCWAACACGARCLSGARRCTCTGRAHNLLSAANCLDTGTLDANIHPFLRISMHVAFAFRFPHGTLRPTLLLAYPVLRVIK